MGLRLNLFHVIHVKCLAYQVFFEKKFYEKKKEKKKQIYNSYLCLSNAALPTPIVAFVTLLSMFDNTLAFDLMTGITGGGIF